MPKGAAIHLDNKVTLLISAVKLYITDRNILSTEFVYVFRMTHTTTNITAYTDCYCKWKHTMFTVRYELNLGIQSRLI